MSLSAGTRLGPYEVLAPIGAGGMGEVYEAHDTKLERNVAIKVLPAELVHDADRLSRFQGRRHTIRMSVFSLKFRLLSETITTPCALLSNCSYLSGRSIGVPEPARGHSVVRVRIESSFQQRR